MDRSAPIHVPGRRDWLALWIQQLKRIHSTALFWGLGEDCKEAQNAIKIASLHRIVSLLMINQIHLMQHTAILSQGLGACSNNNHGFPTKGFFQHQGLARSYFCVTQEDEWQADLPKTLIIKFYQERSILFNPFACIQQTSLSSASLYKQSFESLAYTLLFQRRI